MASSSGSKFQIPEATLEDIQNAFRKDQLTSKELVQYYLQEIENSEFSAVIEVNLDALGFAEIADTERKCFSVERSILHGIPILLKDNIAVKDDQKTTAGSYVLLNSVVPRDAGVVQKLKECGAIILGKANLTEWSSARSDVPDAWSPRGGTVMNPYSYEDCNFGSSTGSAVSVAANLVTVSLGTETIGSIMWPCSENSVVGIKPTIGVTSRSGVIPYSKRQDSVGPICRTVSDAVHLLDAIAGVDHMDEATTLAQNYIPQLGYKQHLKADGLAGKRIGNMWNQFGVDYANQNNSSIPAIFQQHIDLMRDCGAEIIEIEYPNFDENQTDMYNLMMRALSYELKRDLNQYLENLEESEIRSLSDVIQFNKDNPELEGLEDYGQASLILAQEHNVPNPEYDEVTTNLEAIHLYFQNIMIQDRLDAMVAPEGKLCGLLAIGGCPGIIVPAGFDDDDDEYSVPFGIMDDDDVPGPFGIMFGGLRGYDSKLIEIAYAFEQATKIRKLPELW